MKIYSVYDQEFKPYAPCHVDEAEGFRVAVVLPRGTNTAVPGAKPMNEEDSWLTARNKWLLAHPDSDEAKNGAHIGLKGVNIDIAGDIGNFSPRLRRGENPQ